MKSYLLGRHTLLRSILVWGIAAPLLLFSVTELILSFNGDLLRGWIAENTITSFYIHEFIYAILGFVYFPVGLLSGLKAKPIRNRPNLTRFIRHGFIISCVGASIICLNIIRNTRDTSFAFNLEHSPAEYSINWYFISLFLLLIYRQYILQQSDPRSPKKSFKRKSFEIDEIEL